MARIRMIMLSLLAVFAVSAVASASASASFLLVWDVCEEGPHQGVEPPTKYDNHSCNTKVKALAERKWEWVPKHSNTYSAKVISSGGTFKLTVTGKTVECTSITDKGDITGGLPGTDLALDIKFTGCTANSKKCEAESPGSGAKGTILVTNAPTLLVVRKTTTGTTVLADEFKQNPLTKEFVTLEFNEGASTCPNFPTTKVKGEVAAEIVTGTGELNFPSPALEGNTLQAFGEEATLTGKDTQELENGWAFTAI